MSNILPWNKWLENHDFFWVKLSSKVHHKSILIRKMNPTWGGINIQCFHKMAIIWHTAIKFTHCNYSLHYFDWCIKNFFNTHGILILISIYLLFLICFLKIFFVKLASKLHFFLYCSFKVAHSIIIYLLEIVVLPQKC